MAAAGRTATSWVSGPGDTEVGLIEYRVVPTPLPDDGTGQQQAGRDHVGRFRVTRRERSGSASTNIDATASPDLPGTGGRALPVSPG